MIRLGRLTDYGLVLMTAIAREQVGTAHSARDLAEQTKLPLSTVAKLLKELLSSGLLVSYRGASGGYALSRPANRISVAQIVSALEGTIALTECGVDAPGICSFELSCPIKSNLQIISRAVRESLENVMLSDLLHPLDLVSIRGLPEHTGVLPRRLI